jgi:acyl-coenzyme A synthetase/AMP-(fatty) acid ligase
MPQLAERYRIDARSRVLQFASPSYDAYLAETIPVLLAGGTIVCGDGGRWPTPRRVAATIRERRVTHATFPPSYLAELLNVEPLPRLEVLISAGEALHPQLARRATAACARLINAYGPSEATICATTHHVTGTTGDLVPIGQPLDGVAVAVRDGVLEIEGPSVAWGYVGGAGSTSATFLEREGVRRFKTADAADVRGGCFVHLRRIDRQRKILGQLVDLGRIEETLRSIEGIESAVALERDGEVGTLVVTDRLLSDVQAEARGRLAGASYPRHWRVVDDMPRLDSDKVDLRRALALFEAPGAPAAGIDVPLWDIWQRHVLCAGPDGDFFTQGGTSLSAMELLDAIFDQSGVEIDLADFIENPTFTSLSRLVDSRCRG